MKNIVIILSLLFISCGDKKSQLKTEKQALIKFESVDRINTGLSIKSDNREYKIDIQDSLFEYSISPDSSALLVNQRILSNIQISQYYELDKDSIFTHVIKKNISTSAWDSISNKHSISNDDIINPKTSASFTEENKITVKVNGQTELGLIINEVIEINEKSTHNI